MLPGAQGKRFADNYFPYLRTSMTELEIENDDSASNSHDSASGWDDACTRLVNAIPTEQRLAVRRLIECRDGGGSGLRDWISAIAYRRAVLPERIPAAVVDVYVHDPEAVPLHDCEQCGMAVPVRPNRVHGMESEPEQEYFPVCPICGGRTGPYYFWSQGASSVTAAIRRRNPR
jgi:hypothetical protein